MKQNSTNLQLVIDWLKKVIENRLDVRLGRAKEFEGDPLEFYPEDSGLAKFIATYQPSFEEFVVFMLALTPHLKSDFLGKLIAEHFPEGMSAGVPQVLTPVAAEATGLTHGVSAMVVESPQAWVDAIVELYTDEQRWQQMSRNALSLARSNYSFEHGIKGMAKALEGVGVYPPNRKKALVG